MGWWIIIRNYVSLNLFVILGNLKSLCKKPWFKQFIEKKNEEGFYRCKSTFFKLERRCYLVNWVKGREKESCVTCNLVGCWDSSSRSFCISHYDQHHWFKYLRLFLWFPYFHWKFIEFLFENVLLLLFVCISTSF